jgi:hypothetical protein
MPESALRPQTLHRHRQKIGTQVEGSDHERDRAEKPRSVGVEPGRGHRLRRLALLRRSEN